MKKQLFQKLKANASIQNIYQLNGTVPIYKAIPFGLQHILAMFVANIAPILIVGKACGLSGTDTAMLIQSAMLIAGIGTLVQLFPIAHKIGSGLPIVMGISFTFVSVLCFIGAQYGYGAIMGAVLIGGIIEGVLGLFAKFWLSLIAPIVSASVVTAIGFSLLTVGATSLWRRKRKCRLRFCPKLDSRQYYTLVLHSVPHFCQILFQTAFRAVWLSSGVYPGNFHGKGGFFCAP